MATTDLIQKLVTSYSFHKQSALGTPQTTAGNYRTLTQRNRVIPNIKRDTETNAGEIGGGIHPTTNYDKVASFDYSPEMLLSSEAASQWIPFIFSEAVKTASNDGWQYVMKSDQDDINELLTFTMFANLGSTVPMYRFVGVAVDQVSIKWQQGTNVDNATITAALVGTGRYEKGVTFTAPAASNINQLKTGNLVTFSFTPADEEIDPINFLTNCKSLDGEITINRGIKKESNYRACDAQQDDFTVMGRMRSSNLKFGLSGKIEVDSDSSEEDMFIDKVEGAVDWKMEGAVIGGGPSKHTLRVQFPRCRLIIEDKVESDEITAFQIRLEPLYDSVATAIAIITIICDQDAILT